ncbi:hypothetical protein [Pseudomonas sp.]|uniref:hypothetical protein n=1 Tax=Pseudomonas sp. TaxID=306 RepID=UPI0026291E74|nr:hypothetical protein [Pseudomonas sp.]
MTRNHFDSRMQRLILLALREGWQVQISTTLQLTLRKPGFPAIHTGARANDARPAIGRHSPNDSNDHD